MPDRIKALITMIGVPLFCTILSAALNYILAKMGVLSDDILTGSPPVYLDVSYQLILISIGAIGTVAITEGFEEQARVLWPALSCFVLLVLTMFSQAISTTLTPNTPDWGLLRVWIPDIFGSVTVGLTVRQVRVKEGI